MGLTNSANFSKSQNETAAIFKALGHPARVAILEYLIKKNQCICNDLVGELPLSQATISQHLKALKEAGLIKGEIEGNSVCYCIAKENWDKCKNICGHLFGKFKLKCC